MVSTASLAAQAFIVEVASISSHFEINSCRVSATALTFPILEEHASIVPSSSEESTFHFFCGRVAAFRLAIAIILPLQIPYQWLGFPYQRQRFSILEAEVFLSAYLL
jgi:hypothetical protein